MPAYQTAFGASHFGSCKMRAANDVSAAAYFEDGSGIGGIAIYLSHGGWTGAGLGGTSASSPLVAGMLTRLGLTDAISADFGYMYTNIADFQDVTTGNHESPQTCSDDMCKAGVGWDGPSGVGTPNGRKLSKSSGVDEPLAGHEEALHGAAPSDEETGGSSSAGSASCSLVPRSTPASGCGLLAMAGVALALGSRKRR